MKKADEYVKYFDDAGIKDLNSGVGEKDLVKVIYSIMKDLAFEVEEIGKQRKVKSDSGFKAIVREVNDKSNAIARRLKKKYGDPILIENSFMEFLKHEMPEIVSSLGE